MLFQTFKKVQKTFISYQIFEYNNTIKLKKISYSFCNENKDKKQKNHSSSSPFIDSKKNIFSTPQINTKNKEWWKQKKIDYTNLNRPYNNTHTKNSQANNNQQVISKEESQNQAKNQQKTNNDKFTTNIQNFSNQQQKQKQKEEKQEYKRGLITFLIVMPLAAYLTWNDRVAQNQTYNLLKKKIKLNNQEEKLKISRSVYKQIQNELQPLFSDKKQDSGNYFAQYQKMTKMKIIINDVKNQKRVSLKKFLLKKQQQNFPILYIDSKEEEGKYSQLSYHVALCNLYSPVVDPSKNAQVKVKAFQEEFKKKLVVIVVDFNQESSNKNSQIKEKDYIRQKNNLFQKLHEMQSTYPIGKIKANIILLFDNKQCYERATKEAKWLEGPSQ